METILRNLSNPVLGPIFAFLAGVFASASPCALGAMPLLLGHLAGTESRNKRPLISFVAGMVLALTLAGVVAGFLGRSISFSMPWVKIGAGVLIIGVGLFNLGILGGRQCGAGVLTGSSFLTGALYGFSASPCGTPALIAILAMAAVAGGVLKSALLLLSYSFGQSLLLIVAAMAATRFRKALESERNLAVLNGIRVGGGILVIGFGAYVLLMAF